MQTMKVFRRQPRDCARVPIMVIDESAPIIQPPVPLTDTNSVSPRTPDQTKKNRKIVNSFLRHVGKMTGSKDLSLNKQKGTCFFQFKQFLIIIEVPEGSSSFIIYAMVYSIRATDNRLVMSRACMQLNSMKRATYGLTLGLDGDEVTLFYSAEINEISKESFVESLEQFMRVAVEVNRTLGLLQG